MVFLCNVGSESHKGRGATSYSVSSLPPCCHRLFDGQERLALKIDSAYFLLDSDRPRKNHFALRSENGSSGCECLIVNRQVRARSGTCLPHLAGFVAAGATCEHPLHSWPPRTAHKTSLNRWGSGPCTRLPGSFCLLSARPVMRHRHS